jgi:hypothetical protein
LDLRECKQNFAVMQRAQFAGDFSAPAKSVRK